VILSGLADYCLDRGRLAGGRVSILPNSGVSGKKDREDQRAEMENFADDALTGLMRA
jgi:hypothetical protein